MKATLAFYKAPGLIGDKLIKLWTRSKYSHVEIVIGGVWYSSSMRDGGARKRPGLIARSDHWDYLMIDCDIDKALAVFEKHKNQKYDWLGIFLTQFLPLNRHSKNKVFCSELVAEMLGWDNPHQYDPGEVYKAINPAGN